MKKEIEKLKTEAEALTCSALQTLIEADEKITEAISKGANDVATREASNKLFSTILNLKNLLDL